MRGGLAIAILAAVLAALIFTQAAQQFVRDIQPRSQHLEAAAPKISGGPSIADSGHSYKHHLLLPVLNAGSEGSN